MEKNSIKKRIVGAMSSRPKALSSLIGDKAFIAGVSTVLSIFTIVATTTMPLTSHAFVIVGGPYYRRFYHGDDGGGYDNGGRTIIIVHHHDDDGDGYFHR